jgi:hypothetical protein
VAELAPLGAAELGLDVAVLGAAELGLDVAVLGAAELGLDVGSDGAGAGRARAASAAGAALRALGRKKADRLGPHPARGRGQDFAGDRGLCQEVWNLTRSFPLTHRVRTPSRAAPLDGPVPSEPPAPGTHGRVQ